MYYTELHLRMDTNANFLEPLIDGMYSFFL